MNPGFKVDSRRVFGVAGPAMLANITTPLLGIVATAAIGRLGDAAILGGVGMASVVFDCLFWLFGFLRMSTIALTAQALGAGDVVEQRTVLWRALAGAGVIGLALIALQTPLSRLIFDTLGGSGAVTDAASRYFAIRLWSAPFVLANYVFVGWLVGLARVGLALAIQIAINLINLAFTVLLVIELHYGIAGAAIAAIIAEGCGLALGLTFAFATMRGSDHPPLAAIFDRAKMLHMIGINRDILIRTAAANAAYLFFVSRGAQVDDVTLAANAVLYNLMLVGTFFLDGMANAAEQLCGRTYGARDRAGFTRAVTLILRWAFAFGIGTTVLYFLFGAPFVDQLTANPQVRALAKDYLPLMALAPVCGVLAFSYDGIFIGATWTRDMRNLMIVSFLLYLAVWWVTQPLGNTGLWIALLSFLASRGILQMARYPALVRASFN